MQLLYISLQRYITWSDFVRRTTKIRQMPATLRCWWSPCCNPSCPSCTSGNAILVGLPA